MTPSILIRVATALMVGATFLPAQSKPSAQGGGPAKARAEAPSAGDKAQVRLAEVMAMLQDEALTPAQRAEATKKLEEVMAALAAEKMAEAKAGQEPKVARKVERKVVKNGEVVEETVSSSSSDSKVVRDSQSSSSSSSSSDKKSSSDAQSSSDEKKAKSEDGKAWKSGSKAEASEGWGKAEGGEEKPRRLRLRRSDAAAGSEPQEPAPATAPEAPKPPKAPRAPKAPKAAAAPSAPAEAAPPSEPVEVRVLEVAPGELHVVRRQGQDPVVVLGEQVEVVELPQLVELRAELEQLTPKILEEVRVALPESLGEGSEALRIARLELDKVRGQLGTEMQETMAKARVELDRARAEQREGLDRARVEMLRYRDSLQRHEDEKRAHDEALRAQVETKRAHADALRSHAEAKRAHDEALRSHEEAARAHAEAMAAESAAQDEARGPRGRRMLVERAKGQRGADDRQSVERVYEVRTRSVEGQDDEIRRLIDEMRGEMREIRSLMQELRERADQAHERRTGRAGRSSNGLLGGQRYAVAPAPEGDAVGSSPFGATAPGNALAPAAPSSPFGSQPVPALPPAPPAPAAPGDGVGALPPLEAHGVPVLKDLPVLGNLFTKPADPAPASTLPPVETRPLGR